MLILWLPGNQLPHLKKLPTANNIDGVALSKINHPKANLHPNKLAIAESRAGISRPNSRDAGDTCEEAIQAVAGDNSATGADQWFTYTTTLTGTMTVTFVCQVSLKILD